MFGYNQERRCCYCNAFLGKQRGVGVSHGICLSCMKKFHYSAYKKLMRHSSCLLLKEKLNKYIWVLGFRLH